ncbi:MAG: dienelactone hydrolase family protein [Candidatus Palauibacterales bacterium]|nr:dienelactone hydrolase family protein [Candidatus Palauibacterales bacterium]MDP2583894.1 dienelactone hydrolase family protein [Candidatus Palauibacterales bacterium]
MREPIYLTLLLSAAVWACGGPRDARAREEGGRRYEERVASEHVGDRPTASPAARSLPHVDVADTTVTYGTVDGRALTGFLATPRDGNATGPAILVIHEWWGLNDNIRAMARRLAGEGYTALAVDLYGGRVAETADQAMELVRAVDETAAKANLRAAYRYLVGRGAGRIGVIGWCFGGGWSLQTALLFPDGLDAAVIYYGHLVTDPAKLAGLGVPIEGHFGAEDSSIPVKEVRRFGEILDSLGVAEHMYVYEGAGHAFANPSGTRYVKAAADTAWTRTLAFLAGHLKSGT